MSVGIILRTEAVLWEVQIQDIARHAGIQRDYVSRVLNGHHRPKPQTVRRIHEAILAAATERDVRQRAA